MGVSGHHRVPVLQKLQKFYLIMLVKTYAYRPSIVLNGVGDIAAMARAKKKAD